jgi:hypothetical protein
MLTASGEALGEEQARGHICGAAGANEKRTGGCRREKRRQALAQRLQAVMARLPCWQALLRTAEHGPSDGKFKLASRPAAALSNHHGDPSRVQRGCSGRRGHSGQPEQCQCRHPAACWPAAPGQPEALPVWKPGKCWFVGYADRSLHPRHSLLPAPRIDAHHHATVCRAP